MTELSRYEAFEQWAEDYALDHEPLTITDRRMDCWAAYEAGAKSERATAERLLAESQARERERLRIMCIVDGTLESANVGCPALDEALAMPSDSTALDAAIAKAKREENEACAQIAEGVNNFDNQMTAQDVADSIRSRKFASPQPK